MGHGTCTDQESFVRRGLILAMFFFFVVDEGRGDLNTTKSGPSSARQRDAI